MNKFFRCDDCGREVNGINSVNGMNFCAKCYQETFGNTTDATKLQEIWREQFEKGWCPSEYVNELKRQLAEKDKEIVQLKEDYEHCNDLRKLEVEKNNNYHTEKYGLDKPVEELRKIKLSMPEKEWYYKGFDNCERQFASHIADLTLQIKEKDEEIERQKSVAEFYKSYYTGFHDRLVDELLNLKSELLSNRQNMLQTLDVANLIDKKISKIREVK